MSNPQQPIIIKKIKKGGHGHHGGSWKVAYADFMTSMLALFIVLWVIGQSQKTRQAIAEYFKDPNAKPEEIVQRLQEMEEEKAKKDKPSSNAPPSTDIRLKMLARKLELAMRGMRTDEGDQVRVAVDWTDQGLRITLLDRVKAPFFDVGSAAPKPVTGRVLRIIGREMRHVKNEVILEGHTDRRQYKTNEYGNWELSTERANAARRLLISGGLDGGRVTEVRGYADTRLLHPNDPLDPENRRVSILVKYQHPTKSADDDKPASPGGAAAHGKDGEKAAPPPAEKGGGTAAPTTEASPAAAKGTESPAETPPATKGAAPAASPPQPPVPAPAAPPAAKKP